MWLQICIQHLRKIKCHYVNRKKFFYFLVEIFFFIKQKNPCDNNTEYNYFLNF